MTSVILSLSPPLSLCNDGLTTACCQLLGGPSQTCWYKPRVRVAGPLPCGSDVRPGPHGPLFVKPPPQPTLRLTAAIDGAGSGVPPRWLTEAWLSSGSGRRALNAVFPAHSPPAASFPEQRPRPTFHAPPRTSAFPARLLLIQGHSIHAIKMRGGSLKCPVLCL